MIMGEVGAEDHGCRFAYDGRIFMASKFFQKFLKNFREKSLLSTFSRQNF